MRGLRAAAGPGGAGEAGRAGSPGSALPVPRCRGPRAEGARWAVGASAGNPRNRPPQGVLVRSSGGFRKRQLGHVEVRAASAFLPSPALSRGFGGAH